MRVGKQDIVTFLEYEITPEPIETSFTKKTPKKLQIQLDEIYPILHKNPPAVIGTLNRLLAQYPNVPILRNLLSFAYSATGQMDEAEIMANENYNLFPDYLFAKTNLAQIYIVRGV